MSKFSWSVFTVSQHSSQDLKCISNNPLSWLSKSESSGTVQGQWLGDGIWSGGFPNWLKSQKSVNPARILGGNNLQPGSTQKAGQKTDYSTWYNLQVWITAAAWAYLFTDSCKVGKLRKRSLFQQWITATRNPLGEQDVLNGHLWLREWYFFFSYRRYFKRLLWRFVDNDLSTGWCVCCLKF